MVLRVAPLKNISEVINMFILNKAKRKRIGDFNKKIFCNILLEITFKKKLLIIFKSMLTICKNIIKKKKVDI
jgi:hypothetical protein